MSDLKEGAETGAGKGAVSFAHALRLHEDSVRFVRQRLLALEEGRDEDAAILEEFIAKEFGLTIRDVMRDELPEAFRAQWKIPTRSTAERVTLLVNYSREPIWRVPLATPQALPEEFEGAPLNTIPEEYLAYGPGPSETPLEFLPPDPITGESFVGKNAPYHQQPRLESSGKLPGKVRAAIRPWSPT